MYDISACRVYICIESCRMYIILRRNWGKTGVSGSSLEHSLFPYFARGRGNPIKTLDKIERLRRDIFSTKCYAHKILSFNKIRQFDLYEFNLKRLLNFGRALRSLRSSLQNLKLILKTLQHSKDLAFTTA